METLVNAVKKTIINHGPAAVVDFLRRHKKTLRRWRYKIRRRLRPVIISRSDIAEALLAAGVRKGDKVFVHSSLSSFGHIEGGAATAIGAFEEAVGDNGIVAMPSFPIVGNAIEYLSKVSVFDVNNTPSNMGAITEIFRNGPDVARSLHPTHAICAKGANAHMLVAGHEACEKPCGPGSPFLQMVKENFFIISFGAGIQHFTIQHTFADLCGEEFPFNIYHPEKFQVLCIDRHGEEIRVATFVNDPHISQYRWDARPKHARKIKKLLLAGGFLKRVALGDGEILCIRARDLMAELHRFLQQGITVYDLPTAKSCPEPLPVVE